MVIKLSDVRIQSVAFRREVTTGSSHGILSRKSSRDIWSG